MNLKLAFFSEYITFSEQLRNILNFFTSVITKHI